jgi:hypothetical protein
MVAPISLAIDLEGFDSQGASTFNRFTIPLQKGTRSMKAAACLSTIALVVAIATWLPAQNRPRQAEPPSQVTAPTDKVLTTFAIQATTGGQVFVDTYLPDTKIGVTGDGKGGMVITTRLPDRAPLDIFPNKDGVTIKGMWGDHLCKIKGGMTLLSPDRKRMVNVRFISEDPTPVTTSKKQ